MPGDGDRHFYIFKMIIVGKEIFIVSEFLKFMLLILATSMV